MFTKFATSPQPAPCPFNTPTTIISDFVGTMYISNILLTTAALLGLATASPVDLAERQAQKLRISKPNHHRTNHHAPPKLTPFSPVQCRLGTPSPR